MAQRNNETKMKITIIHPSKGRPQQAVATAKKWLSSAKGNVQYLLSIDASDSRQIEYGELFSLLDIIPLVNENHSAIDAINNVVPEALGDLFVVVSDDFDCPYHWDEGLLNALAGKEDFVVKTHDGIQPFIVTLPIMDRKYYDRFGYIYNPEYKHMFCDTEMTAVAHMLGRLMFVPITFPHNHYSTGRTRQDAVNIKNDATWNQGEAVYNHRKSINFGLKDFVQPFPANKL